MRFTMGYRRLKREKWEPKLSLGGVWIGPLLTGRRCRCGCWCLGIQVSRLPGRYGEVLTANLSGPFTVRGQVQP